MTFCQSVEEADALEQSMFDEYVTNGGLKLQRRPSGNDLALQISRNRKADGKGGKIGGKATVENHGPQIANGGKIAGKLVGKSHAENKTGVCGRSPEKMSEDGRKGGKSAFENKTGMFAPENRGKSNLTKMISMLDGRVTSKAQTGHWNKKDPSYIGTWILL